MPSEKTQSPVSQPFSFRYELGVEGLLVAFIVLIGMVVFHRVEHWRYLDALYFTTTTLATVGYGDFTPKTDIGKMVAIAYQLLAIPLFVYTSSIFIERRLRIPQAIKTANARLNGKNHKNV